MNIFAKITLRKKLKEIQLTRAHSRWTNSSLLYGQDIIHYFSRNADPLILKTKKTEIESIDIRMLSGLASANTDVPESELKCFNQLTTDCKGLKCSTINDFDCNTKWIDSRFHSWHCIKQMWDDRVFVLNSDGAHHLAAVHEQAKRQNLMYSLKCIMNEESLDKSHFKEIKKNNAWYCINENDKDEIKSTVLNVLSGKGCNPFIIPKVDSEECLGIEKSQFGMIVIEYIEKNGCVNLIDEIERYI